MSTQKEDLVTETAKIVLTAGFGMTWEQANDSRLLLACVTIARAVLREERKRVGKLAREWIEHHEEGRGNYPNDDCLDAASNAVEEFLADYEQRTDVGL